jgi:site-specific DNA-methyltransferase (cytosine-N4-specific)
MNANGGNGHRNIRDVWTIATQPSGFKHYAAFPLEIPTRCIKAATRPGDTVLDPFCGTGRTLEAAIRLGRNAVGYDLSEKYCDMARQRCSETQVEMIGERY